MCTPYYNPEMMTELVNNGMLLPQPVLLPLGRNGRVLVPIGAFPPQAFPAPVFPLLTKADMGLHGGEGPPQMRKLFVGGLNHETTDDQLRAYFSKWGPVVDTIVIRDPNTKHSRGFGFVTFGTFAAAEAAMADRPHSIGGKTVDSKRAIPREQMMPVYQNPVFDYEPNPGCKLTITGIHCDFHNVEALRLHFEKFGTLDQVEILGRPRGIGFVVFETREGAERALAHKGGRHFVNDRKIEVRPAPLHPRTWRRRQMIPFYEQFAAMSMQPFIPLMPYEEDSSYGGTTEDEKVCSETEPFEDSERGSTSSNSANEVDSHRKNST